MSTEVSTAVQTRSVLTDMATRYGMEASAFEETVRATAMRPDNRGNVPSRAEFAAFLLVAKEYKLNPLLKEIYAFPAQRGGIVPVVSIDGWVNLVNSNPQNDGFDFTFEHDAKGDLISCTCTMHRKDRSRPVIVTEFLSECIRSTDPWKMKHRMLRHKALIQAARYAFGFSGIYDQDEAEKIADMKDVTPASSSPPAPPARTIESKKDEPVDAEFETVNAEAAAADEEKARLAAQKREKAAQAKKDREAAEAETARAAQEEADRVASIESREDATEIDGSIDPDAPASEHEEVSVEQIGEDLKALVARGLPLSAYLSEFDALARKLTSLDDLKTIWPFRMPHNNDRKVVDAHKEFMARHRERIEALAADEPENAGDDVGESDTTAAGGPLPFDGPTNYERRLLEALDVAHGNGDEERVYWLADDLKLKFEAKKLGEKLFLELREKIGEVIEKF